MKHYQTKFKIAALFLAICCFAIPAYAVDLAQAKSQGWVGEQLNGLLGLVDAGAPAEVKTLVNSINAQRQAEYQRIAAKNGVPADEVAKLTAQKVIGQAGPGHYVQTPSGWQRR
ncbi:MAG: YdbL family protein [Methylomonas sp.]|nr:YdbL family protein [Methylomonas sp.]